MSNALPLDLMQFPLSGTQLIEASAGTGKTFTIAALYLRLVLGLDPHRTPLGPDQILVVTFTEAATEELRDRIRQRVAAAREAFLVGSSSDGFLQSLIEATKDTQAAVTLLEAALRQMDEASIFTIHGFCQRMLRQHAFESGSLFSQELVTDTQPLVRHALLDVWRDLLYRLPAPVADRILDEWKTPDALFKPVQGYLGRHGLTLTPTDLADTDLIRLSEQRLELIQEFKRAWLAGYADLEPLIMASGVNKNSYRKDSVPKWIEQITAYAASEQIEPPKKLPDTLLRFTTTQLQEKTKKGEPPTHPLFDLTERLLTETLPLKEVVFSRVLRDLEQRMQQEKLREQQLTFDDLLSSLFNALQSEAGASLAGAIRQQYPVALIDEFQDTDPLQYGIFSCVYHTRQEAAWIMIGDPKQAIYAFRGADIFTYMDAKSAVAQPFTLATNWRSTDAMVDAVNALFQHVPAPFIYADQIPYQPVHAAGKNTQLLSEGEVVPAMTIWFDAAGDAQSKDRSQRHMATVTARQILQLLTTETCIGKNPLTGGDIAVLVRDRFEADHIYQALQSLNLPSVYLSGRDSVFQTQEARDLSLLLNAVANPQDESALRSAMASSLMLLDLHALERFSRDEQAWEAVLNEFAEYHQVWQRLGVLPMLNQLMQRRNLAAGLLAQPLGERRLTNLLHLSELLQQRSLTLETHTALLRWFNAQQQESASQSDEQVLRLESDRKRITIITIHKSKGLEFPVVFLPFASSAKKSRDALFHDADGRAVLDLAASEQSMEKAEQERLAEDLRLLYVALTRSIYACYIGIVKPGTRSLALDKTAIGYLLSQVDPDPAQALATLQTYSNGIRVVAPQLAAQTPAPFQTTEKQPDLHARQFTGSVPDRWRVTSYSALSRHTQSLPELPGFDLEVSGENAAVEPVQQSAHTIFTFPKGAKAGTCLHALFEEISFERFETDKDSEILSRQLEVNGYGPEWLPVVSRLVQDVLACPLDGADLRLGHLADADRRVEMEFMFPVQGVSAAALEQVIRSHDPLSAQSRLALEFEQVEGMLKGFIDLMFRYQGRYYVLDYKSNFLGSDVAAYQQPALEQAMLSHRYDLQYQIYSLALHRLLKTRLPDYDYERHFGGVYYMFLRGIQPESDTGIFACRPAQALLDALDQLFAGGGVMP
ncbi:exodeoxyribonuclease V subunit beta [Neptuniibacter sp. CAU 1671]|uniref:exodeoxyribonuclease V subunit beta n=1 Tax=Neptuniibacter sp. CAU 1671 TaxID=3032593 RepID=UPI0023DCB461|nr:exodeoxyribonuclease V subunit beta [Neptuniibacter sp. CAU 1671]MDF2181997.1 exodeoxyribonuclease V subunit beta [Neptuniibacter sp. CAU 1671]